MSAVDIAIEWKIAPTNASLVVRNGTLRRGHVERGQGTLVAQHFTGTGSDPCRIELLIDAEHIGPGANPTALTVRSAENPFTVLLRDVGSEFPVVLPCFGVAITCASDKRSFEALQQSVRNRKLATNLQRIEHEPDESFDEAARNTRNLECPIWMGLSRDVRIFEMGLRQPMAITDYIQPRFHGNGYWNINLEKEYLPERYGFVAGRGWGCTEKVWRQLDERVLPIFRATREDEDVSYDLTSFVTLENTLLTDKQIRGTHYLVADGLAVCHAFNEEQEKQYQSLRDEELATQEETVLCCRIVATNKAAVPRYAFFKAVHPVFGMYGSPNEHSFDSKTGFGHPKDSDLVFGISKIDDQPMTQQEIAVLIAPGKTCTYEFLLPHRPLPANRAKALANRDMQQCLEDCRAFWRRKLSVAGRMQIPEARIDEMVQAGLLQLDLISYGREPDGPLTVCNGIYGPVSAEVWLNIHFFDSLGLHDQARRGLQYFLEKQHENGFMQNFTGYMLDTGCILFALGEHYLYTRDEAWAASVSAKVIKSCQFIIDWRARNKREDLRGRGYGLMEGKVADPEDQERTFMLNAYAYSGLLGAAKLLERSNPEWAKRLVKEAGEFRSDIRTAFLDSLADGPVIPLADGTWSPTAGAWVGTQGPVALMTDGKSWWTHGSMNIRDDALGPIHLIARDVIDPKEPLAKTLLDFSNELGYSRNVASSQPYYSQHPIVHLRRDEPKAFLKAYYNTMASLADRQTYSWWEHFWHMSPHKTHETAEFLMQTRWMMWMEEGDTLKLLRGIPRAWLEAGKQIALKNVASFFGPLGIHVTAHTDGKVIDAEINCDKQRAPTRLSIRLPHPSGRKATSVEGGDYVADRETVEIKNFPGHAKVRVRFQG